jgi:hypothetical protein
LPIHLRSIHLLKAERKLLHLSSQALNPVDGLRAVLLIELEQRATVMKKLLTLTLLALSAHAYAQDDSVSEANTLTPEQKCSTAMATFGDNQTINVLFSYINWASFNARPSETLATTPAYAKIQTASFANPESRTSNLENCAKLASASVLQFDVHVQPQFNDVPAAFKPEFIFKLSVNFKGGTQGNKVDISRDPNFAAACKVVVSRTNDNYFFDGFKDGVTQLQAPKSNLGVVTQGTTVDVKRSIQRSGESYCDALSEAVYLAAYEQFN